MNNKVKLEYINAPMSDNSAEAKTVKEYFKKLLLTLWEEGEGFSGKRPFGNSGWDFEIYEALIKCGAIRGGFDKYGYVEWVDYDDADRVVENIISTIFDSFGKTNIKD